MSTTQNDKILNYGLVIGFSIVALIYFKDDYMSIFGSKKPEKNETELVVEPKEPENNIAPVDPQPDDEPETPPSRNTYIVEDGDTAHKIAKDHGLTVKELEDLNPGKVVPMNTTTNGTPDYFILVGEELVIVKE